MILKINKNIVVLFIILFSCSVKRYLSKEQTSKTRNISQSSVNIPKGYVLYEKLYGNLNKDKLVDTILIVKATNKEKIITNRFDKVVDRNRRGILIYLTHNNQVFLATKNLDCFYSENEDGGVYYAPQLSFEIKNEKLYINYEHGRYGYWTYIFMYLNNDFKLIKYNALSTYGSVVKIETSINFLTKKKLIRENINQEDDRNEEEFKETETNINIDELYNLSEIKNFEELNLYKL